MPSISVDDLFSAALALPMQSREVLADLLQESLSSNAESTANDDAHDADAEELAQRLSAHFHEAKKIALFRAEEVRCHAASNADVGK